MNVPVPINIVFEDSLTEAVIDAILIQLSQEYTVGRRFSRGGYGYIRTRINGFNRAAKGMPYLVVTDLDSASCPTVLIDEWLEDEKNHNLLFRIAVREIEAWLLADDQAFSNFFGVSKTVIPKNVDLLKDPKRQLLSIVRRSKYRGVKMDILPPRDSTRVQGPNYNSRLIEFVWNHWDSGRAASHSESLERTIKRLELFRPELDWLITG